MPWLLCVAKISRQQNEIVAGSVHLLFDVDATSARSARRRHQNRDLLHRLRNRGHRPRCRADRSWCMTTACHLAHAETWTRQRADDCYLTGPD